MAAEARFFLKQLSPHFELYVSPLNLDPLAPAIPISSPAGYAAELARATGRYPRGDAGGYQGPQDGRPQCG